jgi:cell division protein FtsZ
MRRRQFLQTLNATSIGAMLPVAASVVEVPPGTTQVSPHPDERQAAVEVDGREWDYPKIGIVSVGGIGGACLPMADDRMRTLTYLDRTVAVDTCGVRLHNINADRKVLLDEGRTLLRPHPDGPLAASFGNQLADAVAGLDLVLIVGGMDGTTGSTIAPVIAQVLRTQGIPTLAFADMPSNFEGAQRSRIADASIRALQPYVGAIIPFIRSDLDPDANNVLWKSSVAQQSPVVFLELCRSIVNLTCVQGFINIDFEDLRHILVDQEGDCAFGFGFASGQDGGEAAAIRAIEHTALGRDRLQRASAALVAISGSQQLITLRETSSAIRTVRRQLPPDAYVIYGAHVDQDRGDEISVSILVNGISEV